VAKSSYGWSPEPNVVKSSYGWSPVWLTSQSHLKEKKKEPLEWELSYDDNFFNHSASEKISPQIPNSRGDKQIQQDRPGHGTGTPERDRGRVGAAAGLATYYPHLCLLLARSLRLLRSNTSTSSISKIDQGELLPMLVPSTLRSEAYY
jgi:hypothetical protein